MFHDIFISQIVGKFLRNFSGKVPLFFRKFPEKNPQEISQVTTLAPALREWYVVKCNTSTKCCRHHDVPVFSTDVRLLLLLHFLSSVPVGNLPSYKGKGQGQTLVIVHPSRQSYRRDAQVHGAHQAVSHINLPSHSRYSFTDNERMEGWVNPSPGWKKQLAHSWYATTRSQQDSNPDLMIVSRAR